MAIFKKDDIAGYTIGDETVCEKCITQDELKDLEADQIITTDDIERGEELIFCDRCGAKF